jgi:LacI family transcriptional regulator
MNHNNRRRGREVRLKDVADLASVSLMTVSNVINGRFDVMSQETRTRVEKAILELGYRPNNAGRSLRNQQQASIGMLIVDDSPTFLADPFTTLVVSGLSNFVNAKGFAISLQGLAASGLPTATFLNSVRTDAICVKLSGPAAQRQELLRLVAGTGQPVLLFQEQAPKEMADICAVRQDDYGGGLWLGIHARERDITEAVLLQSRRSWPAFEERERGIRDGLARSGNMPRLTVLRYTGDPFVGPQIELQKYMETNPPPDVVFGLNDQSGIAAAAFLQERGHRVPEDVVVTGFNAFGFWKYMKPRITTVKSAAYEVGARAGAEIQARIETGRFEHRDIVLPVQPIVAGSDTLSGLRPRTS